MDERRGRLGAALACAAFVMVGLVVWPSAAARAEYLEDHAGIQLDLRPGQITVSEMDPASGLLYAGTEPFFPQPGTGPKLLVVDPVAAEVLRTVELGAAARTMTISDDGSYLYLGFAQTVVQYSLPDLNVVRTTSVGSATVVAIDAMPGRPNAVAVATQTSLFLLDSGVVRSDQVIVFGVARIYFSAVDPTKLFGVSDNSPGSVTVVSVTASGFTDVTTRPQPGSYGAQLVGDRIYASGGLIVEAATGDPIGRFDLPNESDTSFINVPFVVDAENGRAYYIGVVNDGGSAVAIFDTTTLALVDLFKVSSTGFSFYRSTPVLLSVEHAIAFATGVGLYFVRTEIDYGSLGELRPLSPTRILDTRSGIGRGGLIGPVGQNQQIEVQITGVAGVPDNGVDSVVLNATVTEPTGMGYLSVFPTGIDRPTVSNLNFVPGQTVANLVTVFVGDGGRLSVYNSAGASHVIFDIAGYYSSEAGPAGSRFHPLDPARLIDTRVDPPGVLGLGGILSLRVNGRSGVPSSGVSAVALNVTAVDPSAAGYLTVWPEDVARPTASNVNFVPGLTVPNIVIVRVPPSGVVDIYNSAGTTNVVVDVVGYFDEVRTGNSGRLLTLSEPIRYVDTREQSPFPPPGSLEEDSWLILQSDGAPAIVMNVTVTEPTASGYLTVYPGDGPPPLSSNLNFTPGRTVANLVIARTNPEVSLYNSAGNTHVIVDIFAVYS